MNVLYLALSTSRLAQVVRDLEFVSEHGGNATLVTTKGSVWPDLGPAVTVHELADAEASHWFVRGERVLVFRLPSLVLRALRKVAVVLGRLLPGGLGKAMAPAEDALQSALLRQQELAQRFHKGPFADFYRNLRPFVLWRTARRNVLDGLDVGAFDAVVVADSLSTPIGWHLAKEHPQLEVAFSLDRERLTGGAPEAPAV